MVNNIGYICYIPDLKEYISIPDQDGFMAFFPSDALFFTSQDQACQIAMDCFYNFFRLSVQVFKRTGNFLELVETVIFSG